MRKLILTGGIALTIFLGSLVPAGEAPAQSYYRGYTSNLRLYSNRAAARAALKKSRAKKKRWSKKRGKQYAKKQYKASKSSVHRTRRRTSRR